MTDEMTPEAAAEVASNIDRVLATSRLADLVQAYFQPDGPFAASTFDDLEPGPPNLITVADLLAVSFLDVAIRPLAVREILDADASHVSELLSAIPGATPIWDASDADLEAATNAWEHFRSYHGIDWVIAGKLLARKRPQLVPIIDSVVVEALRAPRGHTWNALRTALQDDARRDRIASLRPSWLSSDVSILRLLDVAIWMLGSRSTNARRAREEGGIQ